MLVFANGGVCTRPEVLVINKFFFYPLVSAGEFAL